jgi:ABC-type glycerol-3-phosphate transport system substrate-binding protein
MHRKLALPALVAAALTAGGVLVAASPVTAATGGTISVAYENYGTNITLNEMLHTAATQFAAKYPGWKVNLEPIAAPENPY